MPNQGTGFFRVRVRKEALKFASAHMTVFSDGTKENLHGHNYRTEVSIDVESAALADMIPFHLVKRAMKKICEEWDEKVLLPEKCPKYQLVADKDGEIEFKLCGKRYVIPRAEVELLPIDNVITETLAQEFCRRLVASLDAQLIAKAKRIEVRIEEMLGQGASYIWEPGA